MESSSASPRLADTPIFPFQHLLDLAPLVQDLATKYIVRQRAVAPILAQCPAADFQHTRHLTVAQVHVFFWRNRAISENAVNHRRQPVDTLVDGLHPRIVFRFQFIKHYHYCPVKVDK